MRVTPRLGHTGVRGTRYLQCTTMGPGLAAACSVSSTLDTKCSRGLADSGVCWSGQEGKRMCLTWRRSPCSFSSTEGREIRMWEHRLTVQGRREVRSCAQAGLGSLCPPHLSSASGSNPGARDTLGCPNALLGRASRAPRPLLHPTCGMAPAGSSSSMSPCHSHSPLKPAQGGHGAPMGIKAWCKERRG